ncbi:hypothetical protein WICPIJ_008672 [Wickerhamomyces pijperi]|uniref:Uncharacterized protein n=1 Tax=Wickerhamomyces pijperi TaxID=599730 RepID=A0A9P8PVT9_WICPI|nr:hypothetical protein WICPIJ_008672 [Wickerhamomyces pijperi]
MVEYYGQGRVNKLIQTCRFGKCYWNSLNFSLSWVENLDVQIDKFGKNIKEIVQKNIALLYQALQLIVIGSGTSGCLLDSELVDLIVGNALQLGDIQVEQRNGRTKYIKVPRRTDNWGTIA